MKNRQQKEKRKAVKVYVTKDLQKKLNAEKKKTGKSVSLIVNEGIEKHIDPRRVKPQ